MDWFVERRTTLARTLPGVIKPEQKAEASLVPRQRPPRFESASTLRRQGVDPLMAKLFASRGIDNSSELGQSEAEFVSADLLLNCRAMAATLADCIEQDKRVLILADYDCDGATACATLASAFQACGLPYEILIPDRRRDGYGLSVDVLNAEVTKRKKKPDYIITVDNGISSHEGVRRAKEMGIDVLITDHHLPGDELPDAALIVNPNQQACNFPSKSIAGCGVAWYVAWALADELVKRGRYCGFDPIELLPFVAIGTVADVVRLDRNNRALVTVGLAKMRAGQCTAGLRALAEVSGRPALDSLTCTDIGYALAPRLNAAGRIEHMDKGVELLLCDEPEVAKELALELDRINSQRQRITREMVVEAESAVDRLFEDGERKLRDRHSVTVFEPHWHEGVVGIVAGRVKELRHRPCFVFCQAADGSIKGSGRSIPALHLKHVLDEIAAEHNGLILKYGGHGMAAGVSIAPDSVERFTEALEACCKTILRPEDLLPIVWHDGSLDEDMLSLASIKALGRQVWGSGFEPPVFADTWEVIRAKRIGAERNHLKLILGRGMLVVDAIAFGAGHLCDALPPKIDCLYEVQTVNYNGNESVQIVLSHLFASGAIEIAPQHGSKAK